MEYWKIYVKFILYKSIERGMTVVVFDFSHSPPTRLVYVCACVCDSRDNFREQKAEKHIQQESRARENE
jgi:hypothetical protein